MNLKQLIRMLRVLDAAGMIEIKELDKLDQVKDAYDAVKRLDPSQIPTEVTDLIGAIEDLF